MKKIRNVLTIVLLISLVLSTISVYAQDMWGEHECNLSNIVTTEVDSNCFDSLTYDELRILHQPYVDIVNAINEYFGIYLSLGTIDCYFMTREDIIYTITNISLFEHESRILELAEQLQRFTYRSRVLSAMLESDDYDILMFYYAINYGLIDPVYTYYLIQQNQIAYFYDEIHNLVVHESSFSEINSHNEEIGITPLIPFPIYTFFSRPMHLRYDIFAVNIDASIDARPGSFAFVRVIGNVRYQVTRPWSVVTPMRHVSARVEPNNPSIMTSTDIGGVFRLVEPGRSITYSFPNPVITIFQRHNQVFG